MNKAEYLEQLQALLSCVSAEERERVVAFYAEAIDDRTEAGMTEEEAVAGLETPSAVVAQVTADAPPVAQTIVRAHRDHRAAFWLAVIVGSPLWASLLLAVLAAAVAILIGILTVLASVYLVLWVLVAAIWMTSTVLLIAMPLGVAVFAAGMTEGHVAGALMQLGIGLLCTGAGVFGLWLATRATKAAAHASAVIARWTGAQCSRLWTALKQRRAPESLERESATEMHRGPQPPASAPGAAGCIASDTSTIV